MASIKIIARYADGRLVKGNTLNFWPESPVFHVTPVGGGDPVEVRMSDLKAVFIVKSFEGGGKTPVTGAPAAPPIGQRLEVEFKDSEKLTGRSFNYSPTTQGFFMQPEDTSSNNERIFVVNSSVRQVHVLK